jgi:uncharacterized protein YqgV (UPF0045/DUF77 family)
MAISAHIAVYPLRQPCLTPAVTAVTEALHAHGLQATAGPMSTIVAGEDDTVFAALRDAFARAAGIGPVVMTVTLSNACPIPD